MRTSSMLLGLAVLVAACDSSPQENLRRAREALAQTDYVGAAAESQEGLQHGPDEQTAWGLQLVRLEANARQGKAPDVAAQLEQLQGSFAQHLNASRYVATAAQLQAAGQGAAGVRVLDMGRKRFPSDPEIQAMIERAKTDANNPDTLETLRSLGYIQ